MLHTRMATRTSPPTNASGFGLWTREPKAGAHLVIPAFRDMKSGNGILQLHRDRARRHDQIADFLRDAPKETVEQVVDSKDDGSSDKLVRWVLSNGREDSYKSTLAWDGWEMGDFKRNPHVLYVHDSHSDRYLPIGDDVGAFMSPERKALIGITRFHSEDIHPRESREGTVIRMVHKDKLRAVSVGFEPLEFDVAQDRDDGESWYVPIDFKRQVLKEYSVCPIPSNPDTLKDGRAWAGLSPDELELMAADVERSLDDAGWLSMRREDLELVRAGIRGTRAFVRVGGEEFAVMRAADAPAADDYMSAVEGAGDPAAEAQVLKCPACGYEGESTSFTPAMVQKQAQAEPDGVPALDAE